MVEPDNNQMAFWEAMKEKYERRNESLKQQEECLRKRLQQLKQIMEKQNAGDDCDCVPEKLEKPGLVQCLMEKGRSLILGSCKCDDAKVGEELLCACHTDSKAPLDVDPNLCPLQEPSPPEGCLNPTCDFYDPTLEHLTENPSVFSLKTTDIYYMDKLADLVKSEKIMQDKIDDLEKREHSYLTAIHDMQEAMMKRPKTDPMNREFKKLTEGLEDENRKLRDELEDLKLELKHCFERVEGPLKRSLDDQRDKYSKLENQMKDIQDKNKSKEDSYLREINEVKAKLCQACCTMVDLSSANSELKKDLDSLQNNCANLEEQLLKQQLQEAENILKFKTALSKRPKKIQEKGDESEQDLGNIAKKLGETLKEICPCVSEVPSGLTETAENIRQLTELVGEKGAQQRKKRKGKVPPTVTSSCSTTSNDTIIVPETPPKPQNKIKETDDCACSNSSLRLKPKIGKKQFRNSEQTSSSTSLVTKPTMKTKSSQHSHTVKPTAPTKTTVSKGCSCCPAQNECDKSHSNIPKESTETLEHRSDVNTKKIGPSEEVIAVKDLGKLSIPPEETLNVPEQPIKALLSEQSKSQDERKIKLRRKKLAVDTTCDVLDKPPKDIHVVTTIANTGSLEITTEGPPGIIETKVNYLPEGKIEIVTKLINRHNMDSFLDGTLLHLSETAPDFDRSQTYGGEHENTTFAVRTYPEIDCNESKTCGGLCDAEIEVIVDEAEENAEKIDHKAETELGGETNNNSPYGQVLVNNNFTIMSETQANPYLTREWKNIEFRDEPKEEVAFQDLNFLAKPKGKRQDRTFVHDDVTSEHEILRLSSKQSLTHVEKFTKEDNFPDVLDTISEGNEEQTDSNKSDKPSDAEEVEIEGNETIEDSSENTSCLKELSVAVEETGPSSEKSTSNENEENQPKEPLLTEVQADESIEQIQSKDTIKDLNPLHPEAQLSYSNFPLEQNYPYLKIQQEASLACPESKNPYAESLTNSCSTATFNGISEINSECHITESFIELSRNINLFNGKIMLKESKSMYEKRGSRSEYLRICKSATLSLGSLKIDIERLKLSQTFPKVGDFGGSRSDYRDRISVENIPLLPITVDRGKELSCMEDERTALDVLKEGWNSHASYPAISEQTYQCYVCNCSRKTNKVDDQQQRNIVPSPQNTQQLEERIDRLLEIDPLAARPHDDYSGHDVHIDDANEIKEECKCPKKQQDKADPSIQRCWCTSGQEKMIPKVEILEKQGDNVQHDENCTCVDCICNPCHFKKDATPCDCGKCECDPCCAKNDLISSLMAFEPNKPPPAIMVMNFTIPCDCTGKCSCNPCMDEKKTPRRLSKDQSQSKPQPQAKPNVLGSSCKRCAHKVPGAQTEEPKKTGAVSSSSKKSESQAKSPEIALPSTWKSVVGCACSPPSDDKKAVCDCKPCECKPCSYPEKARTPCDCKPSKKESGTNGPSGKCKCDRCTCENCGGDAKTDVAKNDNIDHSLSMNNCRCKLCECLFCSDPNARKEGATLPPNILEGHVEGEKEPQDLKSSPFPYQPDVCICAKCMCDPCVVLAEQTINARSDQNTAKTHEEISHSKQSTGENRTMKSDDDKNRGDTPEEKNLTDKIQSEKNKKDTCPCSKHSGGNEPVECNDCFICCDGEKSINDKEEADPKKISPDKAIEASKIPCDCFTPCSCHPCPDSNVRNEPQMMGDADRAKEEIRNVLNKIGCSCDQVEDNLRPLVKQASNFETTVSRMKMKLNNLQQKCKDKDQIIDAMTKDLRMRSQSGVFQDLLHDLAHPKQKFTPDFNRTYVCDYLPKPRHKVVAKLQQKRSPFYRFDNTLEPILEIDRYLPDAQEDTYGCTKNLDVSGMEIIDIRRVTIDSILMKWRGPPSVNGVTGYQIFVNDELKHRVLSPNRTSAVIDSLDLRSSLEIMLFAITCYGRCEPPALATYRI